MRGTLVVACVASLAVAALSHAAGQKDAFDLKATLRVAAEVPKPTGTKVGAVGVFTGKAVEGENDRAALTWKLTFAKLTGKASAAHIHVGKPGKAGNVLVALCGPCTSGKRGTVALTHAQLRTIELGRAYVNLHTKKNPAGEIRGQIKATEIDDDSPPPSLPPAEPPPSPYP